MTTSRRKCCGCKERFPVEGMIKLPAGYFHSFDCSIAYAMAKQLKQRSKAAKVKSKLKDKQDRDYINKLKTGLETKPELKKKLQKEVNQLARLQDHDKPCISCGEHKQETDSLKGSVYDAGHYRSVGSCEELRFELMNISKQCVYCNRDLDGNPIGYRKGLLSRYGEEYVDWLEGPHPMPNYTHDDLRRMIKDTRLQIKQYKLRIGE